MSLEEITNICTKCASSLNITPNSTEEKIEGEPFNRLICFNLLDNNDICNKVLESLERYELPANMNEENDIIEYNITLPCELLFIIYSLQCYYKNEIDPEYTISTITVDSCMKQMKESIISHIRTKVLDKSNNSDNSNDKDDDTITTKDNNAIAIGKIEVRIIVKCLDEFTNIPNSFGIDSAYNTNNTNNDNKKHKKYQRNSYQKPKALYTRSSILKVLSSTATATSNDNDTILTESSTWYKSYQQRDINTTIPEYSIDINTKRKSFYIIGYYNKLKRNISQTPFFNDDVAPTSVSNTIIKNISNLFYNTDEMITKNDNNINELMKFHGSGREDLDVRMLNNGRKFGIEIINATKAIPTKEIINNHLETVHDIMNIQGVNIVNSECDVYEDSSIFSNLQSETEDKTKEYICLCWCQNSYTKLELENVLIANDANDISYPLTISQQTPLRVLHRRPNLNREKIIHTLSVKFLNPHWFLLTVKTSSGTYVKEFVHGDLGRTNPSVLSLLNMGKDRVGRVDIVQLDVLNVENEKE